jgi:predicted membrane protein
MGIYIIIMAVIGHIAVFITLVTLILIFLTTLEERREEKRIIEDMNDVKDELIRTNFFENVSKKMTKKEKENLKKTGEGGESIVIDFAKIKQDILKRKGKRNE